MKTLPVLWFVLVSICMLVPLSLAQSPGDTAGFTLYPYLVYGSTGSRIALDSEGGVHVTWMSTSNGMYPRHIYYNYRGPMGWAFHDGIQVISSRAGYSQIGQYSGRGVIVYHVSTPGAESLFCALDAFPGIGIFSYFQPPNSAGQARFMWPYLSVDRSNRFQITVTQTLPQPGVAQMIAYTRSSDAGVTWTALQAFDTVRTISVVPASSPVSDKSALVYCHPTDTSSQWKNDIFFVQSPDGLSWDFAAGKVNVTNYGQGGDSLFAYTDLDAIYDYDDNLHIIWNAVWIAPDGAIDDHVFVYHYSSGSGQISAVTDTDMPLGDDCQPIIGNLAINKMSMGVSQTNNALFTVYNKLDTSDCTLGGFANGELFMQYSLDGGSLWSAPVDITNSRTPNCVEGECASDYWPSMADIVDPNYLHVFYAAYSGEPDIWETYWYGPMLYLAYPNPVTGIVANEKLPGDFTLRQNYPNPFNAATTITFRLDKTERVILAIYDITGARVATLLNGNLDSGSHAVVWDATGVPSGVYFAKLEAEGRSRVAKVVLMK